MKLLEQVRHLIRLRHLTCSTEECYLSWIEQFIRFHRTADGWRHPRDMGLAEVEAFLTHLAVDGHVSASTQNQALSAVLFLYRDVLKMDLGDGRCHPRPPHPPAARRPLAPRGHGTPRRHRLAQHPRTLRCTQPARPAHGAGRRRGRKG